MQLQDQPDEAYEALKEELIGCYRRELAYIYMYHNRPAVEYYAPVKALLPGLILHLGERRLHEVLAECWKIAWYLEPMCHPNERYPMMGMEKENE